jgi:calcineurin-like phosphoesterase family protein
MNQTILKTINKYVGVEDTLYFLGDFCFGGHRFTPNYRDQVNCQTIHVCRGNHDHHINKYSDKFTSIQDVLTLDIDSKGNPKRTIFMSHYSHRIWLRSHKGVIHLYGHSHDSIPDFGKSMDVGVDVSYRLFGEYRPFDLDEILKLMEAKNTELVDHHNPTTNFK